MTRPESKLSQVAAYVIGVARRAMRHWPLGFK